MSRRDLPLLVLALMGGLALVLGLTTAWPLSGAPVAVDSAAVVGTARAFLEARGFSLDGYSAAVYLDVDPGSIDLVEERLGRGAVGDLIGSGSSLAKSVVAFKRPGDRVSFDVRLGPNGRVVSFDRNDLADEPGATLDDDSARALARRALDDALGVPGDAWRERSARAVERDARSEHAFSYQRDLAPGVTERAWVRVAGDRVTGAGRWIVVPPAAVRAQRAAAAPSQVLETVGVGLAALFAVGGFWVFLSRLRTGRTDLVVPGAVAAVAAGALLAADLLRYPHLFAEWDPLWPFWVSAAETLVDDGVDLAWVALLVVAFTGAAIAADNELGAGRMASLRSLARGRLWAPEVAAASGRGLLVGLVAGGVLVGTIALMTWLGGWAPLQPRGSTIRLLNAWAPATATLLTTLAVALTEELAYRGFAGSQLLSWTRSRWIAVVAPAVVYGLTHARLDFLPPTDPWWGRAVALGVVGIAFGWAFLRYDALTVIIGHWLADLFVYGWPRMASGDTAAALTSIAAFLVPLVPVVAWVGFSISRPRVPGPSPPDL